MPRSLSSRCHRAASGNLFTTSALWWSCTLQMPIAFCWRSLQRHQLLKPCSNKAPFPCHGGEGEAERVTSGASKPEDKKEKWGWADCWGWQLGCPREAQAASILVAMVTYSTPPASLDQTTGMLLGEACASLFHQWVIELWQRRNLKGRMKQSHAECTRLRRAACTFIAMNIACFDLIQLSCSQAKGLFPWK